MTRVVLDKETLAKLHDLKERIEICDEEGITRGYANPVGDKSLYEQVQVPFTEEELERFENEPGGRSLAEILADLERQS
jgi:hypothetical protein